MTVRVSPFGMADCCVCDRPATAAIRIDDGMLLPYCDDCARVEREAFPDVRVYLLSTPT